MLTHFYFSNSSLGNLKTQHFIIIPFFQFTTPHLFGLIKVKDFQKMFTVVKEHFNFDKNNGLQ